MLGVWVRLERRMVTVAPGLGYSPVLHRSLSVPGSISTGMRCL